MHDAAATPNPNPERPPGADGARRQERFLAATRRLGAGLERMVRRANRRRVTLASRDGTIWLRLPLTLAVLLAIVVLASWSLLAALLVIALLAFGFQISVDRRVDDARDAGDRPQGSSPSTTGMA